MKTRKYRISPNKEQIQKLSQNFGSARFVYNWGLGLSKEKYPGWINLANQLKEKKKELSKKQIQKMLYNLTRDKAIIRQKRYRDKKKKVGMS